MSSIDDYSNEQLASPVVLQKSGSIQELPESPRLTKAMETLRIPQVDELMKSRGAHYGVFKNRPGMLSLFDACKKLEDEIASSAIDSTDESNSQQFIEIGNESEVSLGVPPLVIRPLDPALANVRYLASKPDDAP